MKRRISLTPAQKEAMIALWFLYGNGGARATMEDHKFIQLILERGQWLASFYGASRQCVKAVRHIVNSSRCPDCANEKYTTQQAHIANIEQIHDYYFGRCSMCKTRFVSSDGLSWEATADA